MTPLNDPDGRRLPIKLDSTSNGEFVPVPLSRHEPRRESSCTRSRFVATRRN